MKRLIPCLLLGIAIYLVALLALLPAQRALAWVQPALASRGVSLAVGSVSGSIWNGRVEGLQVASLPLVQADWDVSPLSLLTGAIGADVRARSGDARANGYASAGFGGSVVLKETEGQVPAALIAGRLPFPVLVDGDILLNLGRLVLEDGRPVSAEGVLVWSDARITAPQPVALGNLKLTLEPRDEGGIVARVSDGGGPLEASGDITFEPDGRYHLQVLLAARADAEPALRQSLPMLGSRAPGGKYLVTFNGQL